MASDETYAKMASVARRVVEELQRESDRGCVVLAFAWMDEELTKNLQRFLLPSSHQSSKADELLGPGRPVGDASTKIDLSFRLGLLRQNTRHSLHLFRKLRNDFAHLSSELTFETPSVKDRVLAIFDSEEPVLNGVWESMNRDPSRSIVEASAAGKSSIHEMRNALGTKRLFALAAGFLVSALVLIGDSLTPVSAPRSQQP